jgi:hypothetical protein
MKTVWLFKSQVLTEQSMKTAVFRVVAPCGLVQVHRRFRGDCCLYYQGIDNFYQTARCDIPEENQPQCSCY